MLNLGLTLLIIEFCNFLHQYVKWVGANKNANSRINLIFVGAFHLNSLTVIHFDYLSNAAIIDA